MFKFQARVTGLREGTTGFIATLKVETKVSDIFVSNTLEVPFSKLGELNIGQELTLTIDHP